MPQLTHKRWNANVFLSIAQQQQEQQEQDSKRNLPIKGRVRFIPLQQYAAT